jgi:hypothetical protein
LLQNGYSFPAALWSSQPSEMLRKNPDFLPLCAGVAAKPQTGVDAFRPAFGGAANLPVDTPSHSGVGSAH